MPPASSDSSRRTSAPPRKKKARSGGDVAPEAVLSIAILVLVCIGVVMVYSASSASALLSDENPSGTLMRQGIFAVLALIAFGVCARVNTSVILKLGKPAVLVSLGLLVVVLIPGFGIQANGARSWLGVGPLQMQPSEIAKLALIVWLAAYLARNVDRLDTWDGLKIPIGLMVGMGVLLMLEPDLGTTAVMLGTGFLMLMIAGVPGRILLMLAGAAGVITAGL
ncbi:MAG: FtsW/RodA/SpoVE family cell cycle protein, partial [Acidobacteria bacterium]|nr:FtsW/RodA/SpoVE family cell cycle protein [Acidobacteriota bacterium]